MTDVNTPPLILTFAATDPTSGAGLQADLLTFAAMGCHGLSIVTGVTVQDTAGVEGMLVMEGEWVEDQARLLLEDMRVSAIKVGVLGSAENVQIVAEIASDYPELPLVLDPVLSSGRGDPFADEDLIGAMCELLLPQTLLITPNSIEARRLAYRDEEEPDEEPDLAECASRLLAMGVENVLITGTHEGTPTVVNRLYNATGLVRSDEWERLPGTYHGSGCTLASAIAALLGQGMALPDAVREAQEFTWAALAGGFRPGMGQSLPDRFFWARAEEDGEEAAP
ncbi:bifunctional hydroxymethylpyrimidine kinase/phosphomethylpyrimidine kinase [Derxia lacustris]|uniref:bifunctional hydroxymethylpyrimidine kinase/phosphomethylpyrimidine kinase n=1 Tax=Derxia lacustris TaxID=764842 RepID=UPI000A16D905|nr:hydroxymethylpyrimidine/phosphomethylpyrimidine kinase [Derxia lacustris]